MAGPILTIPGTQDGIPTISPITTAPGLAGTMPGALIGMVHGIVLGTVTSCGDGAIWVIVPGGMAHPGLGIMAMATIALTPTIGQATTLAMAMEHKGTLARIIEMLIVV